MAGGLAALLDDVATIAKLASSTAGKAAGVVVDDAAVTPRYLEGFSPARELPIIGKIALGSLANKAIILVIALLASQFVPWLLTPILMIGGCYLCFEGAEKIWEAILGHHPEDADESGGETAERGPGQEARIVRGAITTDFILSAEIMVISLNQVTAYGFWTRAAVLAVIGVLFTGIVYGAVAVIVKIDDVGLKMTERDNEGSQRLGRRLVRSMPVILRVLSIVGVAAMLWVGGHILLVGMHDLGWSVLYDLVHHLTEPVHHVPAVGGFLAWLVETLCSAVLGLIAGSLIAGVVALVKRARGGASRPSHD